MADLAKMYSDARQRINDLTGSIDVELASTPVPTCPGWSVHDIVAHLTGITEDVLEGRLTSVPEPEQTAAQVARFRSHQITEILAKWNELSPQLEPLVSSLNIWPAVIDVLSHEQDIRGAFGIPGDREDPHLRTAAKVALTNLESPSPLVIMIRGDELRFGGSEGETLTLETTWFDAFRWRMGRRSRSQLEAMAWSGPPSEILDSLPIFGPSAVDIIE